MSQPGRMRFGSGIRAASVFVLGLLAGGVAHGSPTNESLPSAGLDRRIPKHILIRLRKELRVLRGARKRRRTRKRRKQLLALFLLSNLRHSIEPEPCLAEVGLNPLYILPPYFPTFAVAAVQGTQRTVLIGDSTGTIAAQVDGFLRPSSTLAVAVPGNELCHYLATFRPSLAAAIHGKRVRNVVVMTLGGNDVLARRDMRRIEERTLALRDRLRRAFPEAQLTAVAIHPVRYTVAFNRHIRFVNSRLGRIWKAVPNTCHVDPAGLFHRDAQRLPRARHFLKNDKIHYGSNVALRLRALLRKKCKVRL